MFFYPTLLVSLTLFFFAPTQIYLRNPDDFSYQLQDALLPILMVVGLFFLLFYLLGQAIPKRWRDHFAYGLFVIGICLWIQTNYIGWNFGQLDGSEIDWSLHRIKFLVDALIWVCVGMGLFYWRKKIALYQRQIVQVVLALQAVVFLLSWAQLPPSNENKKLIVTEDRKFDFAREENIFFIVLDRFQSDIFQEIINEVPEYKTVLKDFTFFRNTVAAYPSTLVSLPLMFTSSLYRNEIARQDFIKNEFQKRSLPQSLKSSGFDVRLFPAIPGIIFQDKKQMDNLGPKPQGLINLFDLAVLLDVGVFKAAPSFLRPFIFKRNQWYFRRKLLKLSRKLMPHEPRETSLFNEKAFDVSKDIRFTDNFISRGKVTSDFKKVFRFYHYEINHPPILLDSQFKANPSGYQVKRPELIESGKATLTIVNHLLEKLKSLGVYEKSFIIFSADHGARNEAGLRSELKEGLAPFPSAQSVPAQMASASALLLMKRPGESSLSELKISDVEAYLGDLPKTILESMNLDSTVYDGVNIFKLRESDRRERFVLYYGFVKNHEFVTRLPEMHESVVKGFVWDTKAWHSTGTVYRPEK